MKIRLNLHRHERGYAAQCIIAILVIVVGLLVIVKIMRACDRLIPATKPQTNSPALYGDESLYDDVTGAAYIVISSAPVPNPTNDCDCGNSFTLRYSIDTNGVTITDCFVPAKEDFGAVTNYGLSGNMSQSSYNTNQLPIYMDGQGVLMVGSGEFRCVVWRTTNMVDWLAIHTNRMPGGYTYEFTDGNSPRRKAFYQVELSY